jgi:hypothetical protein
MSKALRVDHGPVDPDIADSLTTAEKDWLRSWNRQSEIPGEEAPASDGDDADSDDADYSDLTLDELKDKLRDRDLPVSGNKDELIARLEEDDELD